MNVRIESFAPSFSKNALEAGQKHQIKGFRSPGKGFQDPLSKVIHEFSRTLQSQSSVLIQNRLQKIGLYPKPAKPAVLLLNFLGGRFHHPAFSPYFHSFPLTFTFSSPTMQKKAGWSSLCH